MTAPTEGWGKITATVRVEFDQLVASIVGDDAPVEEQKRRLLAALLEDAGAVKLDFDRGAIAHTGTMGGRVEVKRGRYWLLPVPEGE